MSVVFTVCLDWFMGPLGWCFGLRWLALFVDLVGTVVGGFLLGLWFYYSLLCDWCGCAFVTVWVCFFSCFGFCFVLRFLVMGGLMVVCLSGLDFLWMLVLIACMFAYV